MFGCTPTAAENRPEPSPSLSACLTDCSSRSRTSYRSAGSRCCSDPWLFGSRLAVGGGVRPLSRLSLAAGAPPLPPWVKPGRRAAPGSLALASAPGGSASWESRGPGAAPRCQLAVQRRRRQRAARGRAGGTTHGWNPPAASGYRQRPTRRGWSVWSGCSQAAGPRSRCTSERLPGCSSRRTTACSASWRPAAKFTAVTAAANASAGRVAAWWRWPSLHSGAER